MSFSLAIKRIDESLPLPEYHTKGSVAFDLYSRVDMEVAPWTFTLIPANFIVQVPAGYCLLIAARSSLAKRHGLMLANGIGVIDQDYHGPEDELKISVLNFTGVPVTVKKGDRLGQALLLPVAQVNGFTELVPAEESRGSFGSTGR